MTGKPGSVDESSVAGCRTLGPNLLYDDVADASSGRVLALDDGEASCRRNDGGLRGQRFCDDGFLCSSSLKPSMRMSLVGIPLDVGHAMLAVVAQGRIVIVGQQLD